MNITDKVAQNDADDQTKKPELNKDQLTVASQEEDGLSVKMEGISDKSDMANEGMGD